MADASRVEHDRRPFPAGNRIAADRADRQLKGCCDDAFTGAGFSLCDRSMGLAVGPDSPRSGLCLPLASIIVAPKSAQRISGKLHE